MVSKPVFIDDIATGSLQVIETAGESSITIDADLLFTADFSRLDNDLQLRGGDGGELLLRDYFAQDPAPELLSPDGARLSSEVIESLAGPANPVAYAQAGGQVGDQQLGAPIGEVSSLDGIARVQHTDGSRADLHQGDPIYQGDVVSTGVGSELGIVFVDETVFSLSSNARMVIDELIYNPESSANSMGVSLVQGTFVFISGQVAPSGGMEIDTPTGTIGIRGTTVGVQIATFGGRTRIVNLVDPDTGEYGTFVFSNFGGTTTFSQPNHSLQVGSINSAPGIPTFSSVDAIGNIFGSNINRAVGIRRRLDSGDEQPPPVDPDSGNQQEGNLQDQLPQDLLEALFEEMLVETAAGPETPMGGGAEFRLPPWAGQAFGLRSLELQGVIGDVDVPELVFTRFDSFLIFISPDIPEAPRAAFGLPGTGVGGGAGIIAAIKEDSVDNIAVFAAQSGSSQNELTSVKIRLPGFSPEHIDVSGIEADLAGSPPLGTVEVVILGGVTTIVITFNLAFNIKTFASSFTLDAPVSSSDVDLPGLSITASAQRIDDPTVKTSASATGTLAVDAVLDQAGFVVEGGVPVLLESAADQDVPLNLSLDFTEAGFDASGPDTDASEAITEVIVNLSAGLLLLGPGAPAGASITNNGGGKFTINVADPGDFADAIAALQLQVPAGLDGVVNGTIAVTTSEVALSGSEPQDLDNSLTIVTNFEVSVTGGAVVPVASFGFQGSVALQTVPAGITTISEDSGDNVLGFSVAAGDPTDELFSVSIELPGVNPSDVDITQITADLAGPPLLGTVSLTTPGGVTTISIAFAEGQIVQSFSSSFTLDAPVADSDIDLAGIVMTAVARDISNPSVTGEGTASGTVYVDAVADPVTVTIDAVSASGDEAFAPGEAGTVTVNATFGDLDGSEVHTVVVTIPAGFSVTNTAGGVLDGNTVTWADVVGSPFQAVLQVEAAASLPEQVATWEASASAVEQNDNGDPGLGDVENNLLDNEQSAQASDSVNLDPAATPTVVVNLEGALCIAEDGQDQFTVTVTAQGDDFVQQVLVGNLPGAGEGWITSVTGDDGGSFDPNTGTYTTTGQPGQVILTVSLMPPADSDADVATVMGSDISFTATAEDPDSGDTAVSAPVTADVDVDAVADPVTVTIDAVSASGDEAFAPGEAGTVTVNATFGDLDGSEVHTVVVTIPAGFSVTNTDGGVLDGNTVTWADVVGSPFQAVLQVEADDPLPGEQAAIWSAEATATEEPADEDCDLENNSQDDDALDGVTLDPAAAPTVMVNLEGALCIAEDGQDQFTVTVTAQGDDFVQQVLVGNLPGAGEGWFTTVEGDDNGLFDPVTGLYTTSGQPSEVVLTITLMPPPDSDEDVATVMGGDISFTATAEDPDSGDRATAAPVGADVNVDAVADGLGDGLFVTVDVNDSGDADSEFSPGEVGTVKVSAGFGDSSDGSEVHTVVVDVPAGFSVVQPLPATPTGVSALVNLDGDVEFTVANGTSGFTDYEFQVVAPDSVGDGDNFTFAATATSVEVPTDAECDEENNQATAEESDSTAASSAEAPQVGLLVQTDDGHVKEDTTTNLEITADVTSSGDTLTEVVITAPAGWVLDAAVGGQIAGVGGGGTSTLTLTLTAGVTNFSGSIQATPPADSDLDASFNVSATAVDGSDSVSNNGDFDVPVDAVADGGALITSGGFDLSTNGAIVDLDLTLAPRGGNALNPLGDLFNGGGFDSDGSEAVSSIKVTLTGSPPIASDSDANLVFNAGFGGSVNHTAGSLVWTFTGSEAQLTTLVDSLQLDPINSYTGTISVQIAVTTKEIATEAGSPVPDGNGSNGIHGSEADDSDNAVIENFTFDVEVEQFLAGQLGINEIGLGVGTSVMKSGNDIVTVHENQNYIEVMNLTDKTLGASKVKSLKLEIIGADGEVVTIDFSAINSNSINLQAGDVLTIFEDGIWVISRPGFDVRQTGTYTTPTPYTGPGSVWRFGSDTSAKTGVHLFQDSGTVDVFVANGADKTLFSGAGAAGWTGSGTGTANAAALLGALVDLTTFSGVVGDQDALLAALGRSDIAIDDSPQPDDEGTHIFARVFATEELSAGGPGDLHIPDTNRSQDWTTSNEPTLFVNAVNDDDLIGAEDLNPQDSTDDLNPAQGAGTNLANAGQTVLSAATAGDTLVGGRGQDFLFGDADANRLSGGDHNDFLFGDRGNDRLEGQKGADFLVDVDGKDTLIGGSGDDILIGGVERLPGSLAVVNGAGDLLIGDSVSVGFNVVYVIDVSGSMNQDFFGNGAGDDDFTPPSRLQLAKQAFLTLNQQIIDAGIAGITSVKVIPFNSTVTNNTLEFASADDPNLVSAINALTASGSTQFEPPMGAAAGWLTANVGDGSARHQGAGNFIFFLSDGVDTGGYNPSSTLIANLYGSGGTPPNISNLTIEAFGFGSPEGSGFSADQLGKVETGSTGNGSQVTIVDDVGEIEEIFSGISLVTDEYGEDVILAGGGDDYIFGDTLVLTPDFSGSEMEFAAAVFNAETGQALRAAHAGFGAADWIEGGAGNDSILGQGGDDTIVGQAGNDVMAGGRGGDTFAFSLAANEGQDEILDFSVAEGDILSFVNVTDVNAPGGTVDIADAVQSFANNGGGAGIDVLTLTSGTVIRIHDIDGALSGLGDVAANSLVNGS
jgi:Ca2+-binding RTX toxin-like protein/HSP20 family molecular chaperone IbpA